MAVDEVVGGVELALEEPGIVAILERAAVDGLEVSRPGEQLAGALAPEGVGLCDGFLVELLVLLEACGGGRLIPRMQQVAGVQLTANVGLAGVLCSGERTSALALRTHNSGHSVAESRYKREHFCTGDTEWGGGRTCEHLLGRV